MFTLFCTLWDEFGSWICGFLTHCVLKRHCSGHYKFRATSESEPATEFHKKNGRERTLQENVRTLGRWPLLYLWRRHQLQGSGISEKCSVCPERLFVTRADKTEVLQKDAILVYWRASHNIRTVQVSKYSFPCEFSALNATQEKEQKLIHL